MYEMFLFFGFFFFCFFFFVANKIDGVSFQLSKLRVHVRIKIKKKTKEAVEISFIYVSDFQETEIVPVAQKRTKNIMSKLPVRASH